MSRIRIILASLISCILILAGLLIGSIRQAQTQTKPAISIGRQPFTEELVMALTGNQVQAAADKTLRVPPGRNMILEYLSGEINPGATIDRPEVQVLISSRSLSNTVQRWVIYPQQNEFPYRLSDTKWQHLFRISQPIGVHLQAGDLVTAKLGGIVPPLTASIRITGYLE